MCWKVNVKNCCPNHKGGPSTLDALLCIDEYILRNLSAKNHKFIISIDAKKAFDRVRIHTIIHQLIKWKPGPKLQTTSKVFSLTEINNYFSDTT